MTAGLRRVALMALALAVLGCPKDGGRAGAGDDRPAGRIARPARSLPRSIEEQLAPILGDLRGNEYLKRLKARERLKNRWQELGGEGIVPYLIPLLDEPHVDVRTAVLDLIAEHGRGSPEAAAALVQVVSARSAAGGYWVFNEVTRNKAAAALRAWTGLDFGYDAWQSPARVESAGRKWKDWLGRTGGRIVPAGPAGAASGEPAR